MSCNDICDIAIFFSSRLFFRRNLTIYAILQLSLILNKYRYNNTTIMIELSPVKSSAMAFNIDIAIAITSSSSKPFQTAFTEPFQIFIETFIKHISETFAML